MNLNFARKWRSRTFDEIIGQPLSVSILKNSIYLKHYFPVYLFMGQRGCGKTSTARIFAAAVNCFLLDKFQKNPKDQSIPCLRCDSCKAMIEGNHPDFVEIDAASHTGVDNVRSIIEAASLLPVLGKKKIYLIDEAHMLSKAACNAFLKILEEPPASVFFILATTDPYKIPDTVRSRCFQLLFGPVQTEILLEHLQYICKQENLGYELDGLRLLLQYTDGSVRDSLNLLERVRFAAEKISLQAVRSVVGYFDERHLDDLLDILHKKSLFDLFEWFKSAGFYTSAASLIWESLFCKIRSLVAQTFSSSAEQSKKYEIDFLVVLLRLLYNNELLFLKTQSQHRLLETILIEYCLIDLPEKNLVSKSENHNLEQQEEQIDHAPKQTHVARSSINTLFGVLEKNNDGALLSIFKQAKRLHFDEHAHVLHISFGKDQVFFKELLENSVSRWQPIVKDVFGQQVSWISSLIEGQEEINAIALPEKKIFPKYEEQKHVKKQNLFSLTHTKKIDEKKTALLDIKNKEQWENANMLVDIFPGTITEIARDDHE